MNTNRALTRAAHTKMSKDRPTLAVPLGSTSNDNQNKKRSREDLDRTENDVESFDQLWSNPPVYQIHSV